jgi:hypothetical protein
MSINQLNYKAPEKSHATEELVVYMVHRRAQYRKFPDGLSECEITQSGIAACNHILSICCGFLHVVVPGKKP